MFTVLFRFQWKLKQTKFSHKSKIWHNSASYHHWQCFCFVFQLPQLREIILVTPILLTHPPSQKLTHKSLDSHCTCHSLFQHMNMLYWCSYPSLSCLYSSNASLIVYLYVWNARHCSRFTSYACLYVFVVCRAEHISISYKRQFFYFFYYVVSRSGEHRESLIVS